MFKSIVLTGAMALATMTAVTPQIASAQMSDAYLLWLQFDMSGQDEVARRGRGRDDAPGHVRQGRGADDGATHMRRGRGADDAPGHLRRGRGRDDGPNHS